MALAADQPERKEALDRIGKLYEVERTIKGKTKDQRQAMRDTKSRPLTESLKTWLEARLKERPEKFELTSAINYGLSRWDALTLFLDDPAVAIDNNAAERAIRPLVKTDSLCIPFSNAGKQRFLLVVFGATRAFAHQFGLDPLVFEVAGTDLIGSATHDLFGGQYAVPDEAADLNVRDSKPGGRVRHGEPLALLVRGSVAADLVHRAQRLDAAGGPGLSLTRLHAHAVEGGGNIGIRPSRCHGSHDRQGFFGRMLSMFAGFGLAHTHLRVLASMPVDGQDHIAHVVIDVRHDVLDERAQELLTASPIDTWRLPGGFKILREARKVWNRINWLYASDFAQASLTALHAPERCFPALFELGSNQAVVRVAGGPWSRWAALSERCLVTRLLQVELDHPPALGLALQLHLFSLQRCFDRPSITPWGATASKASRTTAASMRAAVRKPLNDMHRAFAIIWLPRSQR